MRNRTAGALSILAFLYQLVGPSKSKQRRSRSALETWRRLTPHLSCVHGIYNVYKVSISDGNDLRMQNLAPCRFDDTIQTVLEID